MSTPIEIIITPDDVEQVRKFTVWLANVANHARIDYTRSCKHIGHEVLMDELPESALMHDDPGIQMLLSQQGDLSDLFAFEEERLAAAFSKLPLLRQRILTLAFVEELRPAEIARVLNCSPEYVYEQLYRAKAKLRALLGEEGTQ